MKKNIGEFLSDLATLDIKLWVDGDRLRCNAPKEKLTPALKAELAARKAEILAYIGSSNQLNYSQESIPAIPRTGNLPLSFAQQRLWFIDQFEADSSLYNLPTALHIKGALNIAALSQTLNEIVRRHEALRTSFVSVEGQAVQVITPNLSVSLPIIDLQELPETEKEAEVLRLVANEVKQPFDLSKAPLLRAILLRLSELDHVVIFTMHHIVSDGWSMEILIQEVGTLYQVFSNGQPSPLAELPIQYADFAAWQRQWLTAQRLYTQINYWQQQLQSAPELLELPTDHPRPAIQSFKGASYDFELSPELSQKLKTFSQEQGCTMFMVLLAAFKTLLYRYSNSSDIVVGSPIANRNHKQIEGLIGFFVNTLVLRTDLSGNPSFVELLSRVREVALGAYAHQDLPFEQLLEKLQITRNTSHTPVFQVMFVLQNAQSTQLALPGLSLSPLSTNTGTAKFDLTLDMRETPQGLRGTIEYSTDLFNVDTIARMAEHLHNLLDAIVAHPQAKLSDLPLLSASELHQLLVEWNNTKAEYPTDKCIQELFEAAVEHTPHAVAVVFEGEQLTYRQLNQRANQLAHYLRSLGVKPEVLVGICVERSLEMVIGLLGILKAGGAYVPLDPNYPQERLAFMLEDAQASILLTQSKLVAQLPIHKAQAVCLDADWEIINQENQQNLINQALPANTSYILYTSGSTGKPKAVIVEHRNTVAFLDWATKAFTHEQLAGVLASTSICFDLSVFEIFATLCSGGQVILAQNALSLPTLAAANRVTLINTVPSAIAELVRLNAIPDSVRTINLAGEALHASLVQQIYQQSKVGQVFNLYGPSEDTTYSTFARVQQGGDIVTIGRPIANTQCFVLDEQMQPVPIGVCGELYIAGAGITRGYLHRPELTAQKFVPNPFSKIEGDRLYKTGDLVRYLPSGDIEYIGRIDHQVKLRGFRIELGEIEAAINQHPAISSSVVILREDELGSKRLVAYIVAQPEKLLIFDELRRFLENKLPNYMVPSAFVMLEALPLTPNGKVDRRALPAPDTHTELEATFIAPQTTAEKQLADIWAQVLGLEKIGVNDNFFALGGDSILSLQIISKANQAGLHLTPKQMFQYQTIAQLAAVVGTSNEITTEQGLVTGSVPLTPIQHWFFAQNLPDAHHWNQSLLLEVRQPLDPVVLEEVARLLLRHHDALRLRFTQDETGWKAVISPPSEEIPLTSFDFSHLSSPEQETAIATAADQIQASLNLSAGPLVKIAYFNLGAERSSRLLWVIHHLAVDGVSWRVLVEDFQTAYQQLSQSQKIQLPAKTTSFKQWSERLQEYAHSPALHSEIDYWQKTVKSVTPLPRDYPGCENTNATARNISVSLSREETQALLQEVPAAYRTQINDVLLAALGQTFAQWTGQPSILIDLEGHGREEISEDIDLSRTVGWFTSIFPVFLDLGKATHPGEVLLTVKEQLRNIPQRGFSYGVLRYLSDRHEITEVQPEVVFNYLGQLDQVLPESSLFKLTQEYGGIEQSLQGRRTHLLELNGSISQGRLQMNWTYSENLHRHSTIEELAQGFLAALRAIIAHSQSSDAGGFTPSDFAEFQQSQWNQNDLDAIAAVIRGM